MKPVWLVWWCAVASVIGLVVFRRMRESEPHSKRARARQQKKVEDVLVMSDSRDPRSVGVEERNSSWWWASAFLASAFAARSGGRCAAAYYVVPACFNGAMELSAPWCKVRAMLAAMDDFPRATRFLFMDSDAAISDRFFLWESVPSLRALEVRAAAHLAGREEPVNETAHLLLPGPVLLNQDAASHWCNRALPLRKEHFAHCLNAGVVFWRRDPRARAFLATWWNSSIALQDEWSVKARVKWPWEQSGLQHAARRHFSDVAVVPHPERFHARWPGRKGCMQPGCFSHLPEACCVVDHHCSGRKDKLRLARRADREARGRLSSPDYVAALERSVRVLPHDGVETRIASLRGRDARTGMIEN